MAEDSQCDEQARQTICKTLFLFDWDDTIFPTTYFQLAGDPMQLRDFEMTQSYARLEAKVIELLQQCLDMGIVKIVTNATMNWVEESLIFMPLLEVFIDNNDIKMVSARELYGLNSDTPSIWKEEAFFVEVNSSFPNESRINLISVGDGKPERDAVMAVDDLMPLSFIKSVKLINAPNIDDLEREVSFILQCIESLHEKERSEHVTLVFTEEDA